MKSIQKISLGISLIAMLIVIVGLLMQNENLSKPFAVIASIGFAFGLGSIEKLKGYQYTAWIIAAVIVGMLCSNFFAPFGGKENPFKFIRLVVIQFVMFGMGLQMSLEDFKGIKKSGKGVAIGLFCHYTVMPLIGFLLITIFKFEPEIAAGVILIGSCSSGLASNVMAYLAKSNILLGVVVTALSTLVAPLLTPLLVKLLSNQDAKIDFVKMVFDILNTVIVPIGAAFFHEYLKTTKPEAKSKTKYLIVIAFCWLVGSIILTNNNSFNHLTKELLVFSTYAAAAIVVGYLYNFLSSKFKTLNSIMPLVSMAGIIFFTLVTTAAGKDNLLKVGLLLFICSAIHNAAGYFFGYWLSRFFGLDIQSSRTIAFEVGLQNGGMATGIANGQNKLDTMGLAATVFSPWMNISGSILANYWRNKQNFKK